MALFVLLTYKPKSKPYVYEIHFYLITVPNTHPISLSSYNVY